MDNIKIQTTQNVDIEYELASVGDRILASLLDYLLFVLYFIFIGLAFGSVLKVSMSITIAIIVFLPVLLYDLYCEIFFQGKSFGKMIMKIKVVKLDGTRASIGSYFLRWVLRVIDTLLFSPGVALVVIVLNEKGQRLGDMSAGTTVIKMKQKVNLSDTILVQQQKPEYNPIFPQVKKLTDGDVALIKEIMLVAWQTNNHQALQKLTQKTKQTMGVSSTMDDMQFLNTVIQDYNYLSEN